MKLEANRVSAETPVLTVTSASAPRDRCRTRSTTSAAVASPAPGAAPVSRPVVCSRSVVAIALAPDTDADAAEASRNRRMTGMADLLRLTLAAVRRSPERPLVAPAEHVHRAPEPRADPGVGRVLQEPRLLAALDLPADLAPELEVEALVVDRPGPVGVHVDPVVGRRDHLGERAVARQQSDVRHPDHRDPVEALGAKGAARPVDPRERGGIATAQRPDPDAVLHDVDRMRGRPFVVE